jgi:hypothetical protein
VRLAEVIGSFGTSKDSGIITHSPQQPVSVVDRIFEASRSILGGNVAREVRLSTLRQALKEISREKLDAALRDLDRSQNIQLMAFERANLVTDGDREAALVIAGRPMHMFYFAK